MCCVLSTKGIGFTDAETRMAYVVLRPFGVDDHRKSWGEIRKIDKSYDQVK